ncbi:hypothetical protein ACG873_17095 [Mesorhizobium sp. AaZ16]|uniref:hypothetical protein n=1 Tax=Mesorhizobium sp. AaZ16 TaxID=3402289 RepID=UPI00374F7E5E
MIFSVTVRPAERGRTAPSGRIGFRCRDGSSSLLLPDQRHAKEKPAPLHEIANQASPRKVVPGVSASCAVTSGNAAKRIISDRLESSEYGHDPDHVGQILKKLAAELELLPGQLRAAARFVLANPKDVALKTMREQAGLAGVSHSTMVRFAENKLL